MQFQEKPYPNQSRSLFLDTFKKEAIYTIFGSVFHFPFLQGSKNITFYQLTHEQSIIHAADGYARSTGKTGVAFVTSDFGITNAVTGIATAHIDSIPLLVFMQISTESNEGIDTESITHGVCKHFFRIKRSEHIPSMIKTANQLAKSGRPGVVIVEFPSELIAIEPEQTETWNNFELIKKEPLPLPFQQIKNAVHEIKQAKKPLLLIGGGVISSGASKIVEQFIDKTHIPFASTLMGLGALNTNHPLHLGMVGMHGTFAANRAVHRCDLLIGLGVRFSDRITGKTKGFSPHSKKIQIEIDPAEINKNIKVEFPIIGDIKRILAKINSEMIDYSTIHWKEEVIKWRKTSPQFSKSTSLLKPDEIIHKITAHLPADAIVATDVGQHQMWTALHFPFSKPRQLLTSGGFGTMGYGLPAAIGAAVSKEKQPVLFVTGDGSIQMNIQELYHISKNRLNIKIVILRNGYLGMVRQWQQLFYKNKYSQVKINSPNFVSFAESYGICGYRAKNNEEAEDIISRAFSNDEPALLDFLIEEEVNVYPIVPPGGNNTDALSGKDDRQ